MIRFAARRAAWYAAVLLAVNALSYCVVAYLALHRAGQVRSARYGGTDRLVPDLSADASVSVAGVLRSYVRYIGRVVDVDLGETAAGRAVSSIVAEALPRSLVLLALALALAAIVGVVLGYVAFDRGTGRARSWTVGLSIAGFAVPAFYIGVLALLGMWRAAGWTGWRGLVPPSSGFGLDRHLLLPVLVLAVRPATEVARLTGDLLAEEMAKPYLRAAVAKGADWRRQAMHHAFRNVASAVAAHLDNATRYLLSSLIAVELLFTWHGVGMALATSLAPRIDGRPSPVTLFDPALVAGLLTAMAALAVIVDFVADGAIRVLDPRQRERQ